MAARDVSLDLPMLRLGVANGWTTVADVVRLAEAGRVVGLSDAGVVDLVLAADDGRDAVLAAMDALVAGPSCADAGHTRRADCSRRWWVLFVRDALLGADSAADGVGSDRGGMGRPWVPGRLAADRPRPAGCQG